MSVKPSDFNAVPGQVQLLFTAGADGPGTAAAVVDSVAIPDRTEVSLTAYHHIEELCNRRVAISFYDGVKIATQLTGAAELSLIEKTLAVPPDLQLGAIDFGTAENLSAGLTRQASLRRDEPSIIIALRSAGWDPSAICRGIHRIDRVFGLVHN